MSMFYFDILAASLQTINQLNTLSAFYTNDHKKHMLTTPFLFICMILFYSRCGHVPKYVRRKGLLRSYLYDKI